VIQTVTGFRMLEQGCEAHKKQKGAFAGRGHQDRLKRWTIAGVIYAIARLQASLAWRQFKLLIHELDQLLPAGEVDVTG